MSPLQRALRMAGVRTDIGGWKTYTPVPLNTSTYALNNYINQPGSRIYYVDPSQSAPASVAAGVVAGDFYFWNGTNIVDSAGSTTGVGAVAYGTDPMNPSGPIKPYYRAAYCLPNINGNNRVNGTVSVGTGGGAPGYPAFYNAANASGRANKSDWLLIKRGTTLSLEDDLYEVALEGAPSLARVDLIGALNWPGGSSTGQSFVGSYGPLATNRPIITKAPAQGFVFLLPSNAIHQKVKYLAYASLYFDGYNRAHYSGSARQALTLQYGDAVTVTDKSTWFEDITWAGTEGLLIQQRSNFTVDFLRCQLFDTFGAHNSGIFTDNIGTGSQVNWKDSIIARNGKLTNPVLDGFGTNTGFDRNFYYSGENDPAQLFSNNIICAGGSPDQFRAGGTFAGNYFLGGGVSFCAQNGEDYGRLSANTGAITNNAFESYYTPTGGGNNGGGFAIFYGAHDVLAQYNVLTDAGIPSGQRAGIGNCATFGVGGTATGWYHPVQAGQTTLNRITGNFVINRAGSISQAITEGVNTGNLGSADTHYIAGNGTATWVDIDSSSRGESVLSGANAGGVTVIAVSAVAAATCKTGSQISVLLTNATRFWTTVSSVAGLNITLAAALPSGASSGARVTWGLSANYAYRFTSLNTIDYNTFIGQSNTNANAFTYVLETGGAITPTDTRSSNDTVANNTHRTVAAAVGLGYNIDRSMATYMTSIGMAFNNTDQDTMLNDFIVYCKANMRKGQYDPRLTAKPIVNHVRAGVGLAALP